MKRITVFKTILFLIVALIESIFSCAPVCRAQEPVQKKIPIGDLTLVPIQAEPALSKYRDPSRIRYQTGPSIALSKGGRLWVSIMTGGRGEDNNNYVDLITSGDGGDTWSEPKFALDIPGPRRTFDPALWTDPTGKVWWFWCQVYDFWDGRGGLWTMTCDNPDKEDAHWSGPRRLCDGVMKNKPLLTAHGEWWMFVEQWKHESRWWHNQKKYPDWYHPETKHIGANVYSSTNEGKTWEYKSTVPVPDSVRTCDEHMAIELKDGSFRMLLRTLYGMGESRSTDQGRTWSDVVPSPIKNPPARFYFSRLKSGNILLIKNGPVNVQTGRIDITACLSEDDGKTFPWALVLDKRPNVSYPDACQDSEGYIYAIHDFDRTGKGEIILDRFTEADIKAGKIVSSKSVLHRFVRKNATNK